MAIEIKKSHKGLFTKKAKEAGMGVQSFASYVLSHKDKYSASTIKQANFAHNANYWDHDKAADGLSLPFPNLDLYNSLNLQNPKPVNPNLTTSVNQAYRQTHNVPVESMSTYNAPTDVYNQTGPVQPFQVPTQNETALPVSSINLQDYYRGRQAAETVAPQPTSNIDTTQVLQTVANSAQAAGAVAGQGGNTVGNVVSTVAPALNLIPGVGQIASPIASAVGGIINMFGHHKPKYQLPDVKVVRTQGYNPNPQGNNSSILKNGGTLKAGDELDLTPEELAQLKAAGFEFDLG